jgi:hypothetical protein
MPRKKPVVIDSSGNPVKCYTVREAAKELGVTGEDMKLILYQHKKMPYYRMMGKAKKRRITRITEADMQVFKANRLKYDKIADKITQARMEYLVLQPATQEFFAKELRVSLSLLGQIERKKLNVSTRTLHTISRVTGKPLKWFLS